MLINLILTVVFKFEKWLVSILDDKHVATLQDRKLFLQNVSPSFFSKLEAPSVPLELTTEDSSEKLPDKLSRLLAAERLDGLGGPEDRESPVAPELLTPLSTWGL